MNTECLECGSSLSGKNSGARFCSRKCIAKNYQKRNPFLVSGYDIPTGSVGAVAELRVSAELLIKGYEVFRAVSSSCSCDLAVLKGGKLLRIEVRTGYLNTTSNKRYTNKPKDSSRYDVLAVMYPDGLEFIPEI